MTRKEFIASLFGLGVGSVCPKQKKEPAMGEVILQRGGCTHIAESPFVSRVHFINCWMVFSDLKQDNN